MAKNNNHISLDSLAEMELLNSSMKEVLRMYPPLVMLLRKLKVDHKFGDFLLPKVCALCVVCVPCLCCVLCAVS
jgi:cytochrome P450